MSVTGEGSATSRSAQPAEETISIGEARSQLADEFPDLSISKIRYLEEIGLIQPARTRSSYRKFSPKDIQRLRYVLQMQAAFLPLKVIKKNLDAIDRGLEVEPGTARPHVPVVALDRDKDGLPAAEEFTRPPSSLRISRDELIEQCAISAELLDSLEQYGLIVPQRNGQYDEDAFRIASAAASMAQFGFEARHLRSFRTQADREVGLIEQVVAPMMHHKSASSRGRAEETIRELAALSVQLHFALVRAGLRRQLHS